MNSDIIAMLADDQFQGGSGGAGAGAGAGEQGGQPMGGQPQVDQNQLVPQVRYPHSDFSSSLQSRKPVEVVHGEPCVETAVS
jgi:hypothetical protein